MVIAEFNGHTLDPSGTTASSSMASWNSGAEKNLSGKTSAGLSKSVFFDSDRFKMAIEKA